jgi:hypothetical protein
MAEEMNPRRNTHHKSVLPVSKATFTTEWKDIKKRAMVISEIALASSLYRDICRVLRN